MGCDVHPVIQVAPSDSGKWWENRLVPNRERFYLFFETLAGVRSTGAFDPIFPPRGYPEDCGKPTGEWEAPESIAALVSGEHTPSWFTLREAKEYRARLSSHQSADASLLARWDSWIADMEHCKKFGWNDEPISSDDDVRVVFNFDS